MDADNVFVYGGHGHGTASVADDGIAGLEQRLGFGPGYISPGGLFKNFLKRLFLPFVHKEIISFFDVMSSSVVKKRDLTHQPLDKYPLNDSFRTMAWDVRIKKKAAKNLSGLPYSIQERFKALVLELKTFGPVRDRWPNYGPIRGAGDCRHCHIKKGRPTYVAVWKVIGKNVLEVTYVGTHENADYRRVC